MAVLFMDGFEGNDIAAKWSSSSSPTTSTSSVRNAFTGSRSAHGNSISKNFATTTKLTVGFAWTPPTSGSTEIVLTILSASGVNAQLNLQYTIATGVLVVRRGSTTIATAVTTFAGGSWYYLEFQCTINASTGTAILHVNGVLDSGVNFTGNTANVAGSTTDTATFIASGTGAQIDDVYIADGTGSVNDDFIGDVRVYPIVPDGAGISTQFTPSSGSNWSNVNGLVVQSTNTNSDSTSGHKDDYTMGNLPSPATGSYVVKAVQACVYAQKSDAGAASIKNDLYIGSTHYQGASHALTTSYLTYTDVWDKNPDTGPTAWTVSDVNGIQAGMAVV